MWKSLLHFLYPPSCLHCRNGVDNPDDKFCKECLSLLEVIDPSERCPHCFSSHYETESNYCLICHRQKSYLVRSAAAFDYSGPAKTLIQKLKDAQQPYLAKGAAAYMVFQFTKLRWPMPDCIVPVPMAMPRRYLRGYNQSLLLAERIGEILKRPVVQALCRSSGDYRQSSLPLKKRSELDSSSFSLSAKADIKDATILLVDDVTVSGATMQRSAEALFSASPASIYALAFCKDPLLANIVHSH